MWAQSQSLNIPQAPSIWRSQYPQNPTIFKGLSFYGSARAREIIAKGSGPVFSMRLRDSREAGIFVYAEIEGREGRVLDPKWCCAGRVDDRCARNVVASIINKGGMIILPTEIETWERVHKNELRWNRRLKKALVQQADVQEDETWVWNKGKNVSLDSSWPCPPQ